VLEHFSFNFHRILPNSKRIPTSKATLTERHSTNCIQQTKAKQSEARTQRRKNSVAKKINEKREE